MTKEMDEFICQILIGGMFVIVALLVLALLYIIYQAIPEFILLWKTHRMNLKIRKEERKKENAFIKKFYRKGRRDGC